jgi:hypothetical protein
MTSVSEESELATSGDRGDVPAGKEHIPPRPAAALCDRSCP